MGTFSLKNLIIPGILLVGGVVFRLWLSDLYPQPQAYDQMEYHEYAVGILNTGYHASPSRMYGYPMILAALFSVFGPDNFTAVFVANALIDAVTAIIIFFLALRLFGHSAALISCILYAFNPFTSVYTGLMLTEIPTAFLVIMVFFTLWKSMEKTGVLYGVLTVFLAAYLVVMRPSFLMFSGGMLLLMIVMQYRIRKPDYRYIMLLIAGFALPFVYSSVSNLRNYRQFSPLTVDNLFVRELYISLHNTRSPKHAAVIQVFPEQVQKLYGEYSVIPKDAAGRKEMAAKYFGLASESIRNDPGGFIRSRLAKMWYVWEKHFLYYYREPENPLRDFLVYWGNIVALSLAGFGLVTWSRSRYFRSERNIYIAAAAVWLVVSVSVGHSISLAEERYSLPAYPVIFLFAGYGLYEIWRFFGERVRPSGAGRRV